MIQPSPERREKALQNLTVQIVRELFNVPDCPDSTERGRACRYCEAEWLSRYVLLAVESAANQVGKELAAMVAAARQPEPPDMLPWPPA